MYRLLFLALFMCTALAIEGVYRWSNALELSWGWLALRAGFYGTIMLVSSLGSRWERRRERAGHSPGNNMIWPVFWVLFGAVGTIGWGWTLIDALMTGRIGVSRTPELHTSWSDNPWGFGLAIGYPLMGALLFLLMFVAAAWTIWNHIRARHGPAWP